MDREGFYDSTSAPRNVPDVKVVGKNKGILADGYRTIATPVARDADFHAQTKSEREKVSTPFNPGPGTQHHGKASPSSEESWVKTKPNHTYHAR